MTTSATVPERFIAAFNARDLDGMADCFTVDAVYHDLFYGDFVGPDGVRELFERTWAECLDAEWAIRGVLAGPSAVSAEWEFAYTVAPTAPSGAGRRVRFSAASVFDLRDGRCSRYREYFDRGAILLAVGISPAIVARIVANRPTVHLTVPESVMLPS